jgi:hypothetical protein
MKVAVAVPFIDTGCEWRRRALVWTTRYWTRNEQNVVLGTSNDVNRSAARNNAAAQTDADVLVFADADTWIPMQQFSAMVEIAVTDKLIHGYTTHLKLTKRATMRLYDFDQESETGEAIANQPLGIIAVSRKVWEAVGGFDERFVGWGGEDRAFELACIALFGKGHRIPGMSYHLWHPNDPARGRATPSRRANSKLALRYKDLSGVQRPAGILPRTSGKYADPEGMLQLLTEPGGPLHPRVLRGSIARTQNV